VAQHFQLAHHRDTGLKTCTLCSVSVSPANWSAHEKTTSHVRRLEVVDRNRVAATGKRKADAEPHEHEIYAADEGGFESAGDDDDERSEGAGGLIGDNGLFGREFEDEFSQADDGEDDGVFSDALDADEQQVDGGLFGVERARALVNTTTNDITRLLQNDEAIRSVALPFDESLVTPVNVSDLLQTPRSADVKHAAFITELWSLLSPLSRVARERALRLIDKFSSDRCLSRSDVNAASAATVDDLYPMRLPKTPHLLEAAAGGVRILPKTITVNNVAAVYNSPLETFAVVAERHHVAAVAAAAAALPPAPAADAGADADRVERGLLPTSFVHCSGYKLYGKVMAAHVGAGATLCHIALYKDGAIIGGKGRVVLRVGALFDDTSFYEMLPMVTIYDDTKVNETALLEAIVTPFLKAMAAGVRVTFSDGTSQLFAGALYIMPADMADRWSTWMLRRFTSPFVTTTKAAQFLPGLTAPTHVRSMSGSADVVNNAHSATVNTRRIKTKAAAQLSAAGLAVAPSQWSAAGVLEVPFVFKMTAHMVAMRFGVGAFRAGADPLHTLAAGIMRNLERNIGWVVFHYIAQKSDKSAARIELARLSCAIASLPTCIGISRPSSDFFVSYAAKVAGKRDVRTIPGSSKMFADVFKRAIEWCNMVTFGHDELDAWLRQAALVCRELCEFERLLLQSSSAKAPVESECTSSQLSAIYGEWVAAAVALFDKDVVTQAIRHAQASADADADSDGDAEVDDDDEEEVELEPAPVQQAQAAPLSQGAKIMMTPKLVDAAYIVLAAQHVAPFSALQAVGALGEHGHSRAKAIARESNRHDDDFVRSVCTDDSTRLLGATQVALDGDDERVVLNRDGRVLPIFSSGILAPQGDVLLCLEQLIGGAAAVAQTLQGHSLMHLIGLFVDTHRIYSTHAIDRGAAQNSQRAMIVVRHSSSRHARAQRPAPQPICGVLTDVLVLVKHSKRSNGVTQRSARQPLRIFLILEHYDAEISDCASCQLPRSRRVTLRGEETVAVELLQNDAVNVRPMNEAMLCPLPATERGMRFVHHNSFLPTIKAKHQK
jgi:hypothetical protein